MKNLKVLALAFVIGTVSVFAKTNEILDVPVKQIGSQLADLFENPEFEFKKDLKLNVIFKFNEEGEIVVLHISSRDEKIRKYVTKTLNDKTIQIPGEATRVFRLPISLKRVEY